MSNKQRRHQLNSPVPAETVESATVTETPEVTVEETPKPTDTGSNVRVPEAVVSVFNDEVHDLEQEKENREKQRLEDHLNEEGIFRKLSLTSKMSIRGIAAYVKHVRETNGSVVKLEEDRNHVVNKGPAIQVALYRNIMDIITKTDDNDFRMAMNLMLSIFHSEREYLTLKTLMTYGENLPLNPVELRCYSNLMTLLVTLADVQSRSLRVNREINLPQALEYGFSESAKARLIEYFQG